MSVVIGKPKASYAEAIIEPIESTHNSNELIFKKFICNSCGIEVTASKYTQVIKVEKLCDTCLTNKYLGVSFKLNREAKAHMVTYDSLRREKKSKKKVDNKKLALRQKQSRENSAKKYPLIFTYDD